MKKAIKVSKKALSVTLALLMVFTSWVWFAPDKAEAAEGNKYYVKVYVNIYDGSDGYGGAYAVEETTGKPKNYSWATNDGWYGRINMTGFTVFGEKGDYDAQDVSAALLEAEKLDTYYDMSGLSNDNASGDWDSKAIAKTEYTFVLDSFPVEIFWINDENNWDGGNTGFAIRKLTVATSENGTEHTMWEGLAGSDSETYNYYGSITPTGIHTCFEDYAKNYNMNDYKFYKSITTSSQRAWTDPYTYGSAGTYYLNEYANGGVSATFSEGTTSVASTVDYIDTSSTDTYYVNYTNHSKTQIAEITGTYNDGNFVTSPYRTKLNPGETRSFEINKSNYSKLAKYKNAANFTFEYTLSDVYASDELNAPLAKFIQPTYIGLWNESSDSPKYITDEDGDGSTGYTLKMSDNYSGGNNSMTMTNTFQVTEGIIERNSATSGSGTNSVSFNYNYYVDVSNVSTWENTGLRIYVTENEYYRLPFQPKEHPSECGTITLSGNYANTDAASITIADIAFTNVTEDFWYSHSQASGYSTYGYYNQKGTPMWATQGKDAQATFFNNNPGWLRFAGTMIEPSADSADPAKIVMDKMVYRENQNGQKAYFSGTINVYAFDKAELRDYIQKTLLDFAPMSLRYNTTAFGTYQNKLVAAMNVLADQKTTQKAVATALSELKSAVDNLQTTDNLINQVAELTHVQYVGSIGSEIANQTDERYVLVTLGEHTVPQKTEYIGNGEYKNATNKNSDLKTNYSKTDTNINIINYRYWNIDYSAIDGTIADLETAINNFDDTAYKKSFKTDLENAKANLEAMKATVGVINTPTSQEDIDVLIINAENLITHLGNNMRVHQWIEDDNGNYVAEHNEATHWYTCKICGYELVYDHTFAYENLGAAQHKVTCVTNDETFVEGCGYTFNEDHVWVEGETVATSCTEGNTSYSCICGATKTEATTVSNHKFAIADNGDGTHIRKCSECGVNEPDAVAEAHTLSYVNNNDGTHTATCSVCSATETVAHTFINPVLTRPALVDGEWVVGYYTSTCICGATDTTEAERADYKAYDKAVADLNALLANEKLTTAAKTEISNVLTDNDIADNYIATAEEQKIVNDATASLKVVLDKINNDTTGAYEKVDFTGYNAAVNASESLKDVMTDADKAAVVAEMQKVTDAGIDENTSKAVGQKTLDDAADAISAINAKYGECAKGNHTDTTTDNDHNCDVCGTKLSDCADNDKNHKCDTCGATLSECADNDKNHKCDICGTAMGTHADTNNDHNCEYCGDKVTDCADDNNDHNCDVCGDKLSECADGNNDHNCDVCGTKLSDCADNDKNHKCDTCGATLSECADNDKNHKCDICGTEMGTHADSATDDDHVCDYGCGATLEDCSDVSTDNDHNCDVCGKADVTAHNYVNPVLTRPTLVDGEWVDGYYTSTCNCGATSKTEAKRADYEAYDKAVADLNALLANENITQAAKNKITDALESNDIPSDRIATAEEQKIVDDAAAALNVVLGELTDDECNLKDEYEKVDFSGYNAAVNASEALEDVMTDADKAVVAAEKQKVTDAGITTETSKAVGQQTLEDAAAAIAAINAKYGDCADGNHVWGEPVLTTDPTETTQGEYTETCKTCGTTQITKVDRANYSEFDTVVDQLEDLLDTENLTEEAKTAIKNALAKAEALDKNLPDDATTVDGKLIEGGQDEIDALVTELNSVVANTNASISDGSALKPDYEAWKEAEGAYDALDKKNIKDEIKAEADALKAEIAEKQDDDTLTQATATQDYIDVATNRLNEIIAGINDGTLIKDADFTEADKDLAEAKDKASSEYVSDETREDIQIIEDALNELRNDPTTNGNDQDEIDALEDQLEKIIEDINAILNAKPDFGGYDASHDVYEGLVEQYGDKIKDGVAEDVAVLDAIVEGLRADETATKGKDQKTIDDAKTALDAIIEGITGGSLIKDPADFTEADKDLADAKDKAENNNVVDSVKEDIKDIEDALNELKNDPTTDGNDQPTIDALEKELEEIIKGIEDGTLIKDADFTEVDKDLADAKDKAENNNVVDSVKEDINDIEDALNDLKNDPTTDGNDQPTIDALEKELEEIIKGIEDGTLIKDADFTEVDKDLADAKNKAENNNVVDSVKDDIKEIEDQLDELRDTATADDQPTIDALEKELEEIIKGIEDGSLIKDADFTEAEKDLADAKDKTENNNVVDSVKEDIKDIEDALNDLKNDPTTDGNDQPTIDALEKELEEIIKGIEDGTLIKDADFTEADKDLADAKDKAENNNVVDSVKEDIKDIEDALNELKNDPTTDGNDQPTIDALEKELEDIIAGITDGSLVKPDYSGADDVIGKAENDIDNGGKLSDEDKAALEELKKNLDEIKNDPTSNKKDDQSAVDSIKDSVQNIINKYSGCAEGNYNYVAKVVEPGCETTGYTEHKCTVCGKAYRDNLKPATGHSVITVPAMDATCSEEGRTEGKICENCGKIFVEIEVIPRLPHTDEDEDGVCDICGASDLYAGCACLCHNKHWFWHIIYLIVRIIWRVFGIHQYCACGFVHFK